jgi:transposase
VINRYKAHADIERGFRVLKSEIKVAPVYHRLLRSNLRRNSESR